MGVRRALPTIGQLVQENPKLIHTTSAAKIGMAIGPVGSLHFNRAINFISCYCGGSHTWWLKAEGGQKFTVSVTELKTRSRQVCAPSGRCRTERFLVSPSFWQLLAVMDIWFTFALILSSQPLLLCVCVSKFLFLLSVIAVRTDSDNLRQAPSLKNFNHLFCHIC